MSLIIDALKKAQQIRLKESEGSPILKYSHLNKERGRNSKKHWILIVAGLTSLCVLLLVLLKPAPPPLATQSNRAIVFIEKKPSVPVVEKISEESSRNNQIREFAEGAKEVPSPLPIGEPIMGLPYVGAALSGGPSLPKSGPSIEERGEEPLIKQMVEERKVKKAVQPEKSSIEKVSSPTPPASLKEEVSSKSIGVEQEGGKDRTLTSDVLIHFNSGVHFYNQRELSKAIQAYHKVIEMDPAYIEAYNNLGIIYQKVGDFENALKSYQKSVEINPQYEKAYNNLGILFLLKDRYEEAVEAFQKALAINSNNIESHINLGILFKKKGEWEKAIESYQKALAINPLHRETHYNMALLYEQLENIELAIGHYQTFIQLSSRTHPDLVSKVERHLNILMKTKNK